MDPRIRSLKYFSLSDANNKPIPKLDKCVNFKDSRKAIERLKLQNDYPEFENETYVLGLIYDDEIRLSLTINLEQFEHKNTGVNRVLYKNIGLEVAETKNIRDMDDCWCDRDPEETLLANARYLKEPTTRTRSNNCEDVTRESTSITVFGTKENMNDMINSISRTDDRVIGVCMVLILDIMTYMSIQTYEERLIEMNYYDRVERDDY